VDLDTVRTFAAVAGTGQFSEARAAASVRPGRRALRVDVIGRRLAPAALLGGFHRAHPGTGLEVMTLFDASAALAAVVSGTIDASFRAVTLPAGQLPRGVEAARVLDEPVQLLTGPGHALAGAHAVTPAGLAGHRIWMPGLVTGTEWDEYYGELAAAFGLTIDVTSPDFGTGPVLDVIAGSPALATLVGEQTRLSRPAGAGLRRIPLHDPAPVYPHSLIWRTGNRHPALAALRRYLAARPPGRAAGATWTPGWARQGTATATGSGKPGGRRGRVPAAPGEAPHPSSRPPGSRRDRLSA
jgi:DNA-binding transcriptional LysR family regulator